MSLNKEQFAMNGQQYTIKRKEKKGIQGHEGDVEFKNEKSKKNCYNITMFHLHRF